MTRVNVCQRIRIIALMKDVILNNALKRVNSNRISACKLIQFVC